MAPPFKKAEFDMIFGEGISKIGEIIDLGTDLNIIKKSGSWFSYGETKLAQGRDAVRKLLLDNPELSCELETKIREKIKEVDDIA
jgi:recombination protein RecA